MTIRSAAMRLASEGASPWLMEFDFELTTVALEVLASISVRMEKLADFKGFYRPLRAYLCCNAGDYRQVETPTLKHSNAITRIPYSLRPSR
jgi:hypothetical protein